MGRRRERRGFFEFVGDLIGDLVEAVMNAILK